MELKDVMVRNNEFAIKLFKAGHVITDFRRTVFYFKEDGTTQKDLDVLINSIVKR